MESRISFEEIARLPPVGLDTPVQFAFGDEGRALAYLYSRDGGLERGLYLFRPGNDDEPVELSLTAPKVGEEALSLEEQLRRERTRDTGLGITTFSWAESADVLLVPLPDGLHVLSGVSKAGGDFESRLAVSRGDGEAMAPQLSPDGSMVAFVREGDLHVAASDGSSTRRLTSTAGDGLSSGLSDYAAQEEMDRGEAFWWSPDSRLIAYLEIDERHIPLYRIAHQGDDATGEQAEEAHRYPFAGKDNVTFKLAVVPAAGGESRLLELPGEDCYFARADWAGERLVVQLLSRSQQDLEVFSFDPATGERRLLLSEQLAPWIDLHGDFRHLRTGEWLWSNEQSGYRHLELRSESGELVRRLTEGEWQVDALEAVDEDSRTAYFTGTKDGHRQRHLYSVSLDGGEPRRVTQAPGSHVVAVEPRGGLYVDRHASLSSPPEVSLRSLEDDSVVATLHAPRDRRIESLRLEPPEVVTVPADDGTELDGLLWRASGSGPGPLVVYVYGGPHVQLTADDWMPTAALRAQALRERGVHVLTVDNRGSRRRGIDFEAALWHAMGQIEVADQVAGVRWAVEGGLADPERVGVYGWSYGGYMTLRCLELAPDVFKVGVAGAPVTDWDGYDSCYTERYMGHPAEEEAAYRASSVLDRAGDIGGELMIVHGLIDENVHFRHSARLINRLVEAKVPYRLLLFPGERHLPRKPEDRAFMEEQVLGFLLAALGLEES